MTTMYDSTDPSMIPTDAAIVAGYTTGLYAWDSAGWARFPTAQKVTITVTPAALAKVLDVETFNATPESAPGWATKVRATGVAPCVYCSRYLQPQVQTAFSQAGVAEPDWWIADWTGSPHLLEGTVATQYANPPTSGGVYDLSETDGAWPASTATSPPPPPGGEYPDSMQSRTTKVIMVGGHGWCASPVPVYQVVSVIVLDEDPGVVGHYDQIPAFVGAASAGNALVFGGGVDGTYSIVVWSVS